MNLSDYLNLCCFLIWCALIFTFSVLIGRTCAGLGSSTHREDKHDDADDDDTTPPPTAKA